MKHMDQPLRHLILLCCVSLLGAVDITAYTGPEAVLVASYEQQVHDQLLATLLGSYREHGMRDPAWDAELEALLPVAVDYALTNRSATPYKDALAIATRLKSKEVGCKDPLLLWAGFVITRSDRSQWRQQNNWCNQGMRRWAQKDASGLHSALPRLHLEAHCLATWGTPDNDKQKATILAHSRDVGAELTSAIKEATGDEDLPLLLRFTNWVDIRIGESADIIYEAVDQALEESKLSPGARGAIRGVLCIECAWAWRGNGWAKSVTKEGWAGFRKYLAIADSGLEAAWAGDIHDITVARSGITVAGASRSTSSIETWFERGLSVHPDDAGLLASYRNFLRPRWGGSFEKLLTMAENAVATGRYDTQIPWEAVNCFYCIIDDAHQAKQEKPFTGALAERAIACIDTAMAGYLAVNPHELTRYTCIRAATRYNAGRNAEALELLKTLDRDDIRAYLDRIKQKGKVWYMDPFALLDAEKNTVDF